MYFLQKEEGKINKMNEQKYFFLTFSMKKYLLFFGRGNLFLSEIS